jgi:dTDP-4-amino-4,6-dideoxygalactose transaminase
MKINFNRLDIGYYKYKTEYDKAVLETLQSGVYILGSRVEIFEKEFANYIGSKFCVGLNSGLDALILAFRALDISEGDEVIVPANTYIASILGITENKATPVFVDPDDYFNIDTTKIEQKINKKTKAILVVHLYGQSANMSEIKKMANKHKLFLIEDCAQSHGAKFDTKNTGTWGDIGCFSFYPTKNIGAFGDSGAIVTDNEFLNSKIRMLRNYGSVKKYHNEIIGVNSRMDEIQASLLSVKLKHYNELKSERLTIAAEYLKRIKNEHISLPRIRINSEHVWHLFVVLVKKRDDFQNYLSSRGIGTMIHYPIPPHLSKAYEYLGHRENDFPLTEYFSNHLLSLPLYEGMTNEEIDYIIDTINSYDLNGADK